MNEFSHLHVLPYPSFQNHMFPLHNSTFFFLSLRAKNFLSKTMCSLSTAQRFFPVDSTNMEKPLTNLNMTLPSVYIHAKFCSSKVRVFPRESIAAWGPSCKIKKIKRKKENKIRRLKINKIKEDERNKITPLKIS